MVDWLTCRLPLHDDIRAMDLGLLAGRTVQFKPGGEVDWQADRWLEVMGSFDSAIRLRTIAGELCLSGNPVKMLTGQNLDGPDDVGRLYAQMVGAGAHALAVAPDLMAGDGNLTRIDITRSFQLGSQERVREVLRVASITARARHQGRASTANLTVYLGKHSRRHSVKLYSKYDELKQHPPTELPSAICSELQRQAQGLLRCEVTMRSMELKERGLRHLAAWADPEQTQRQWTDIMARVDISSGVELANDEVLALPRRLRTSYELWLAGRDCAELMCRRTYYRHRRELLTSSNGRVDIGQLRPRETTSDIAIADIGEWLRKAPEWHATGELAEWIAAAA
ncbi:MAG TPA: phage/plasmid replication protein, II/X family [Ktedonobacterales bacterium]|nr:phage/plasmid replication protein, II/X family [Ktedonobacterales bacterium]